MDNFPKPSQQEQSQKLWALIRICIDQSGGQIGFDQFMRLAQFDPKHGYYSRKQSPFGMQGDFITAPEISPIYAYSVARQCSQILKNCGDNHIIEIGAGSGVLAKNILLYLEKNTTLPDRYTIVEQSAALRETQHRLFLQEVPQFLDRIQWLTLDQVPKFSGVVLANEVFDALPFKRIMFDNGVLQELQVTYKDDGFVWAKADVDYEIKEYCKTYVDIAEIDSEDYQTELHISYASLLQNIAKCLQQGVLLIMDYGTSANDYYNVEQHNGTMRCFYRHRVHDDPFVNIGYQDITCNVQFSALAQMATSCGFKLAGYTTQANFLLGNRIDEMYNELQTDNTIDTLKLAQQIKTLTMPDEMGERFKVMALAKDFDQPLDGFTFNDHSYSL